jgi:hypothetical protein
MRTDIKFEREGGNWYAVIKDYQGPKSDLQMILGADRLLYIIAQGDVAVELTFDTTFFDGCDTLTRTAFGWLGDLENGGATYQLSSYQGVPYGFDLWLCEVTCFVFGEYPPALHFLDIAKCR